MKTYIRFDPETGRQIETSTADSKPSAEYYVAPSDFDPAKIHERVDGTISEVDASTLETERLAAQKKGAQSQLERLAEEARLKHITPGDGKAMVYRQKQTEAMAYTADNTATCPILEAEAAARGVTLPQMVAIVEQKSVAWQLIAAEIEALSVVASGAIDLAQDAADLDAALLIDWPG